MTNNGQYFKYHVPNAIYNPNSPFNILGIPFLCDFFGLGDSLPTQDGEETYVRSSASKTRFVWDHGRHTRDFTHDARSLPVLTLDSGVGFFQAFCARVQRHYQDRVHFAFSSAHSFLDDTPKTPLRTCPETTTVTPNTDFQLGQDILFTDGKGSQARVVCEGATPDGLWHTLCRDNGSRIVTPASHVSLLDQLGFSNMPSTPLDYCREVGIGISKEAAQVLAYPCDLTPSQQELVNGHNWLYHLPFNHLF